MKKQDGRICIILLNWNGKKDTLECLESLGKVRSPRFFILIVDNGSTDGSQEYCKLNYPWVRLIELPKNVGFAAGVNAGIIESKGTYIILLNNDTEVDPTWLSELHSAIEAHPEASFFACKMLDFKDHSILDSAGDALTWSGNP